MPRPSSVPRTFVRYAWSVLAYNVAVVVWGAFVRASGSGAGCGNHWPLCGGEVGLKHTMATLIEFAHRSTSGIDTMLVAGLIFWAYRIFAKGHQVRLAAALSGVFLVTESFIGAALVKFGLVGNDASTARAVMLSIHLTNMLTLLACLALTAWWAAGNPRFPLHGRTAWLVVANLGAMMLLGVTGAIAALADTLFPAQSFLEGAAQDWNAHANVFVRLRAVHPVMAVAVAVWLVYFATSGVARGPRGSRLAFLLMAIVAAQLVAGGINMLLAAPVWMQLVHLALADALWIALVLLCASVGEPAAVRAPRFSIVAARI